MPKLHEILAVEGSREQESRTRMGKVQRLFGNPAAFIGEITTTQMFDAAAPKPPDERRSFSTSVMRELRGMLSLSAAHYEVMFLKEASNQSARSDLVVDGEVLMTEMPVTFLLGLEKRLRSMREVFAAIPIADPSVDWVAAPEMGPDLIQAQHPVVQSKTQAEFVHKVLYEATDNHPAQIEKWTAQVPVGRITRKVWSGLWPQARKNALLKRMDALIEGALTARQRANEYAIPDERNKQAKGIHETLATYLLGGDPPTHATSIPESE